MDERPVLPPAATPEELSTKLVTVDVPSAAPATVPIASARRACFTFGMFPSLSVNPASVVTPTNVPIVSKISTKRNVKNTVKNFKVRTCEKSNFQNKGASGRETALKPSGIFVTPKGIPTIVVRMIPIRMAPGTLKV